MAHFCFPKGLWTKRIAGSAVLTWAQPTHPWTLSHYYRKWVKPFHKGSVGSLHWAASEEDLSLEGIRGGSWNGMKGGGKGVSLNSSGEVVNSPIKVWNLNLHILKPCQELNNTRARSIGHRPQSRRPACNWQKQLTDNFKWIPLYLYGKCGANVKYGYEDFSSVCKFCSYNTLHPSVQGPDAKENKVPWTMHCTNNNNNSGKIWMFFPAFIYTFINVVNY